MRTCSLQSGSNGNAIYVECDGVRLLFDAGISPRRARQRLALHGGSLDNVAALIVSHAHSDHIRYAARFQAEFGVPVFMTRGAWREARVTCDVPGDAELFEPGASLVFGGLVVHTLLTPHDAADTVAFVVEGGGRRLGILTDLGHPFPALAGVLRDVHGAFLETNYSPRLLAASGYPSWLKRRIAGPGGHLSNEEAAGVAEAAAERGVLEWVAAAHLSAANNRPDLAVQALAARLGDGFPVRLASRSAASPMWVV